VPSLLTLLGEKSWYLPHWLDRLLPSLTIEAPHEREGEREEREERAEKAGTAEAPGPA
jgi:RND superfamily putative drug exporter